MNRILAGGIGLLTAFAVVAPALAGEPPPPRRAAPARVAPQPEPEPVRQASNWSGGQIGSSNGGSFSNNAFVEPGSWICPSITTIGDGCHETPFSFDERASSFTTGGFLGYNMQFGAIVIGVEGDIMYKDAESSVSQRTETLFYPNNYFLREDEFQGTLKQGWNGSVRGRIGVLVMPTVLVYGTGGLAFGKVSGSLSYNGYIYDCGGSPGSCLDPYGSASATTHFSETRSGYTVGGGIEVQLLGPLTGRMEYRYTDLGSFTKGFPVDTDCSGCVSESPGATIDLHPTSHNLTFGIGLPLGSVLGLLGGGLGSL